MPTRYLGEAQPYRGKLSRAKWRTLRALAWRDRLPEDARPQTLRSLEHHALIRRTAGRYTLTAIGAVAVARYEPRRRSAA